MERLEKSYLSYGECKLINWFPISEYNAYGIIPLVGFATSCFTAGILMEQLADGFRFMTWAGVWFFIGFFVLATLELFYGFHSKQEDLLLLWISFKAIEIVGLVSVIVFISIRPFMGGMFATCIVNLFILLILSYIGYRKYKHLKMNNEDVLEDYPSLENYSHLESKVNM